MKKQSGERPGKTWGVWGWPGTMLKGSGDHSGRLLEGFWGHFRIDFGFKKGPVCDLLFGMVFPPKMGLKWIEKGTKIE